MGFSVVNDQLTGPAAAHILLCRRGLQVAEAVTLNAVSVVTNVVASRAAACVERAKVITPCRFTLLTRLAQVRS